MEKEFKVKEFKVEVPDGYEIDKENSTFECIKFKHIADKLPKTWEEYCIMHDTQIRESWITEFSNTIELNRIRPRNYIFDRNLLPNILYSKAMLALCQLIQLRDCYNDGWIPNWIEDNTLKYCIEVVKNEISTYAYYTTSKILTFKTRELCTKFLNNFRDLIEIAKPLL